MSMIDKIIFIDSKLNVLNKLISDTRKLERATNNEEVIRHTHWATERLINAKDVYKRIINKYNENLTPEVIADIKETELRQLHVVTGTRRKLFSTEEETYEYIDLIEQQNEDL